MKAMILAAGLGTRLKPLTDTIPKALVKVHGMPMLEITLRKLIRCGFDEIIINVHHFPEQIIKFLKENNNFGIPVYISDETKELLDTGGGIARASWFLDGYEPVLIHNVDVLSKIDLNELMSFHQENEALVTTAVSKRKTKRYLVFDSDGKLTGWKNIESGDVRQVQDCPLNDEDELLAFSGIHVLSGKFFDHLSEKGRFNIIDAYLRLACNHKILAFKHEPGIWFDLGSIERIHEFEKNNDLPAFL
jgi:NDP-sugar pyrophosphorylase family protein